MKIENEYNPEIHCFGEMHTPEHAKELYVSYEEVK